MIHGILLIPTDSVIHSDMAWDMVDFTILGITIAGIHHGDIVVGTHPTFIQVGTAQVIMVADIMVADITVVDITVMVTMVVVDTEAVLEMDIIPVQTKTDLVEVVEFTERQIVADHLLQLQDE